MKLAIDPRFAAPFARIPKRLPYLIIAIALLALLAVQVARIFWAAVVPVGPIGAWTSDGARGVADETLLARFDPFFRLGDSVSAAVVTSLPVKLFGVRLNEASGQGSAIIATPDGVQSSFAVGDEIMPGIKLKSVAFDSVTIDRGGADEQIFLDQSVAAPVAQPGAQPGTAPAAPSAALANDIAYAPRLQKGQVTGFVVSPKGSGAAFNAAGLKAGDVLTAINGQTIRTTDDVASAMAATPASGIVSLAVERGGQVITLSARAGQ
jgi:general secretion pathway protein C